jgi:two-component system, NarL family, nitrate/nitrite response regulator NarL
MRKHLCIVEDDPDMRLLIRTVLRSDERIEVTGEAESLEEALDVVAAQPPDLIILDHFIHGTVMGLQAAPVLRDRVPAARIILFTSHDLSVEVGREPAVDHYLQKHKLDELLPAVQQLLSLT